MAIPVLKSTAARDEKFAGVTYHIEGELVPVLHLELGSAPVYFEHYILLWKEPAVQIGVKSLKGSLKRVLAGMPIFMTEARGPGQIGFSRDGPGHIFAIDLNQGEGIEMREHQFLAATASVDYTFTRVQGIANMLLGGTGFFIDHFTAQQGEGIVWVHGYGNVFEVTLAAGEQIDIEPGGWVYKDRGVRMDTQFQKLSTGLFASAGQVVWNRFTGPGRVGIQSMYLHMPTTE
ncbi:MAG TPA: AIM24 family protein [Burkholderiales bacterium]|nr:AIM24 family protein [Burkholderiales bacterium]